MAKILLNNLLIRNENKMKVIKLKSFDLLKKKTNKEIINQSINIKIKKDIKNLSPVKIKLSLLKK